jgi:hypothetical protein
VSVKDEEDLSTKQVNLDLIVAPEGANVKLKDIVSLWTTNIMQMYGEADSVDGAPVAEVAPHSLTCLLPSPPPDRLAIQASSRLRGEYGGGQG